MLRPARELSSRRRLQELSDDELRRYIFHTTSPETFPGYDDTRPGDGDALDEVVHRYDIPHSKNSREGYVWCAFCQKRTHYIGGLIRFESGLVRSVGWACCEKQLQVSIRSARREFSRIERRAIRLHQFDSLGAVMPDVLREIEEVIQESSLRLFDLKRTELQTKMSALWRWVSTLAFHDSGVYEYNVEIQDYSGTALKRESDSEETGQKLKGQRTIRERKRTEIRGWRFAHPNAEIMSLCENARALAKHCVEFYAQQDTKHLDIAGFKHGAGRIRGLIEQLEHIQDLSGSLSDFFDLANRKIVVGLRNMEMKTPAYSVTRVGIRWKPEGQDVVDIDSPENYKPARFRCLGRLRRAAESY